MTTKCSLCILGAILYATSCTQTAAPEPYGVLPSERQVAWHETELYGMVCIGIPTYFHENLTYGATYGDVDPSIFNPTEFSAEQIVQIGKDAGMKGILLVAKHHEGFCLWPSKTTGYDISSSPYKDGKGDMVQEFSEACKKLGLKFGVYNSPWDRNHGDYGTQRYVDAYREQLRELYTNYGDLFLSWHDGAIGGDGYYGGARESRVIDRYTYFGWDSLWKMTTRKLQPGACIFSDIGPDLRWIGNEGGFAGETCWATFSPKGSKDEAKPALGDSKYWEAGVGHRDGKYWMPGECDVPLRPRWFYYPEDDERVKTPYQLFDLYFRSVGRGQALDIGLAPNGQGIMHENDVISLRAFGDLLRQTFATNLAQNGKLTASNVRGGDSENYGVKNLLDDDRYSYWATDDGLTSPDLVIELEDPVSFNIIQVRENIKLGQRIEEFGVDVWENEAWREIGKATSVGALRLIRLSDYITASKVRLRIIKSPACIAISDFGLFAEPLKP